MRSLANIWRHEERRIVLVPTMGYLHAGHVSLLEAGRRDADRGVMTRAAPPTSPEEAQRYRGLLVLSIFVNPTQFGPNEDLARYPRDLEGDLAKAERAGADVAFVPEASALY